LTLSLKLLSGFHIGTGYGLSGTVDSRIVRGHDDLPYIPGSSLKGRLRHHLQEMVEALDLILCTPSSPCQNSRVCPVCNLFGSTIRPGSLFFSDLHLAGEVASLAQWQRQKSEERLGLLFESQNRTQVMVSRRRGVALEKHLFTMEVGGPELAFSGSISGWLEPMDREMFVEGQNMPSDLAFLVGSLGMVTHIGGCKSRGLGRCQIDVLTLRVNDMSISPLSLLRSL